MHAPLQQLLLRFYARAERAGLLRGPIGSAVFDRSYRLYKRWLEAPSLSALRRHVLPGTTVIDVGANAGFFAGYFAEWAGPSGRVIAIEPEAENFARLLRFVRRRHLEDRVEPLQAAAAEAAGRATLAVDPAHPGGHHLAPAGVPVTTVTIDGLVEARGNPRVSLIKIDVQGAEMRVLLGAEDTLRRSRPAMLIELDDVGLRGQHTSAAELVDHLAARGYHGHVVASKDAVAAAGRDELLRRSAAGAYVDALFLCSLTPDDRSQPAPSPPN
jgi:FkbM family methyltransferase